MRYPVEVHGREVRVLIRVAHRDQVGDSGSLTIEAAAATWGRSAHVSIGRDLFRVKARIIGDTPETMALRLAAKISEGRTVADERLNVITFVALFILALSGWIEVILSH